MTKTSANMKVLGACGFSNVPRYLGLLGSPGPASRDHMTSPGPATWYPRILPRVVPRQPPMTRPRCLLRWAHCFRQRARMFLHSHNILYNIYISLKLFWWVELKYNHKKWNYWTLWHVPPTEIHGHTLAVAVLCNHDFTSIHVTLWRPTTSSSPTSTSLSLTASTHIVKVLRP